MMKFHPLGLIFLLKEVFPIPFNNSRLVCNKKPRFLETGFYQTVHVSLQHCYTAWNFFNDLSFWGLLS